MTADETMAPLDKATIRWMFQYINLIFICGVLGAGVQSYTEPHSWLYHLGNLFILAATILAIETTSRWTRVDLADGIFPGLLVLILGSLFFVSW